MYRLIFCDDNEIQMKALSEKVLQFCGQRDDYHDEAVLCTTAFQLLKELKDCDTDKTIVFMDICLKEKDCNGIGLAEKINSLYPDILLVFLTGYPCYASDVYETEHCYFMLKDELEQRLPTLFDKIIPARVNKNRHWLNLHIGFKVYRVRQSQILFLERNLRKTKIYMKAEPPVETTEKLDILMEQLNSEMFIRCHNSYIINLEYVREIRRTNIILEDGSDAGKDITVSRAYGKEVKRRFTAWGNQKF